jgi:hypothetical protein
LDPPANEHVALLYENKEDLDFAVSRYLNEGLRRQQFCVYATVHFRDKGYVDSFSLSIENYKENVEKGNLLIVDLASFYISALLHDMKPFEETKKLFADRVKGRRDKHIRFVGDGTGFLFRNKHFDECAMVEQWWEEKPFEGSYVCPFPKQFFDAFPHDMHSKRVVVATHDSIVDASGENPDENNGLNQNGGLN